MIKSIKSLVVTLVLATVVSVVPAVKTEAMTTINNNTTIESTQAVSYVLTWKKKNGKWYGYRGNTLIKNEWINDKGSWYYATKDGSLQTGWKQLFNRNGKTVAEQAQLNWYYFSPSSCKMFTGYNKVGKYYYYFQEKDNEPGYKVPKGALYCKEGFKYINGCHYYVKSDGKLCNGWIKDSYGSYCYVDENNGIVTGKAKLPISNNSTKKAYFYFNSDGKMLTGLQTISNDKYYFSPTSGQAIAGWKKIMGKWYYFDKNNNYKAVKSTSKRIGSKLYHFDKNGICTNP